MKILCIQLKQLGDVLMTTPAVRALANRYPGCEIDFLTQTPAHTVYQHNPFVREVYRVKWQLSELLPLMSKVYRRRYDLLIDFSGSSKTANFAWLTRIPKRIGYRSRKQQNRFTHAVDYPGESGYSAARKLALLAELDVDCNDVGLDFFLPDDATEAFRHKAAQLGIGPQPLFAVSPVSKRNYKVWPAERFAAICDRLVETRQGQIFFLIGPGEAHFAEAVRDKMKQPSLPIDDGLSLYEAACLLDLAQAYIGNDNGLMHLALARKRPTFGIFGRPKANSWTSPLPIHCTIEHDPGCKDDCYFPGCKIECLSGVTVAAVDGKLEGFLDELVPVPI